MAKRKKISGSGKRMFKEHDEIICMTDRYVVSWGYDYTYADARKEVAKECGLESEFMWNTCDLEWKIFEKHPAFESCREAVQDARIACNQVLSTTTTRYVDGASYAQRFASSYVRDYIYQRLKKKIVNGAERKITFGTIMTAPDY